MKNKILKLTALLLFAVISLSSCSKDSDPYINVYDLSLNDLRLYREFICGIMDPKTLKLHYYGGDSCAVASTDTYVACRGEKRIFNVGDFKLDIYCGIFNGIENAADAWLERHVGYDTRLLISSDVSKKNEYVTIPISPELNDDVIADYAVTKERLYRGLFYVKSLDSFRHSPINVEIPEELYAHEDGHFGVVNIKFAFGAYEPNGNVNNCWSSNELNLFYHITDGKVIIYYFVSPYVYL